MTQDRHPGAPHPHDPDGMRHALGLVAAQVPEPDLAGDTWRRGRRVRRQRQVATAVGGVAAVAVIAAGWGALSQRPDASPAGVQHETAPALVDAETPTPDPVREAQQLWARLKVSCLEVEGMEAWVSEDGTGYSRMRPQEPGLPGLEESSRRCDEELLLVLPAWAASEETTHLDDPATARGRALVERIHLAYSRTSVCLGHNGFPAAEPPQLAEFQDRFTEVNGVPTRPDQVFVPPWHPYERTLDEHGTVRGALDVCPVNRYLDDDEPVPPQRVPPVPGADLTP